MFFVLPHLLSGLNNGEAFPEVIIKLVNVNHFHAFLLIKIGKLPVRVGIEAQYYVVRKDSSGPEWNIRLIFSPIIGNPFKK